MAPINQTQPMREAEKEIIEVVDGLTELNLGNRVSTLEAQRESDYALITNTRSRLTRVEELARATQLGLIDTNEYVTQLLEDMQALPVIERGAASFENIAAGGTATETVIFANTYPSLTIPEIFTSINDAEASSYSIDVYNVNYVGFQISVKNNSAAAVESLTVLWMALSDRITD